VSLPQSHTTLALFAKFIARTMGLHFTPERLFELDQKMATVARSAGYDSSEQYQLWLMSAPLSREQLDILARALTIGETYFLRDPVSYQVLEEQLIPDLITRRRATEKSLRLWSAGCSTGEEPYTLAILLSRIISDLATWNISLLATDINPQALVRGRQGVYSPWSFRNSPAWLMDYFTKTESGRFEIVPRIRSLVRFDHLNLADDWTPGECGGTENLDVIFCRNVMLYFEPKQIERTMAKFHASLRDGGWLFVGPTEVDQRFLKGFTCLRFPGAFVLRKGGKQQETRPAQHPAGEARLRTGAPHSTQTWDGLTKPALPGTGDFIGSQEGGRIQDSPLRGLDEIRRGEPRVRPSSGAPEAAPRSAGTSCHAEVLALYQAGHYEQAASGVRVALESGPQPADTLALGARALANLGRLDEAREFCESAIAADRLSAQNHFLLSIILEHQGDLAAAASSLKNVLFIDHDHLLAYFALGNLFRQTGDDGESERNFANALRLLERLAPNELLPDAEGMTAGGLAQAIRGMTRARSCYGKA
jgi:chemotaxis protein methyltransferase CheR